MSTRLAAALAAMAILALAGCESAGDDDGSHGGSSADDDDDDGSPGIDDDDDMADDDDNNSSPDDDDDNDTNPYCNAVDRPDPWQVTVFDNGPNEQSVAKILLGAGDLVRVFYSQNSTELVTATRSDSGWEYVTVDLGVYTLVAPQEIGIVDLGEGQLEAAICGTYTGELTYLRWGAAPVQAELLTVNCLATAGLTVDLSLTRYVVTYEPASESCGFWRGQAGDWAYETVNATRCFSDIFALGDGRVFVGAAEMPTGALLLLERTELGWNRDLVYDFGGYYAFGGLSASVTPDGSAKAAYGLRLADPPRPAGLKLAARVGGDWLATSVDDEGEWPMLVVDQAGASHLFYSRIEQAGDGIRYALANPAAGVLKIADVGVGADVYAQAIAADSKGCVHLAYLDQVAKAVVYMTNRKAE